MTQVLETTVATSITLGKVDTSSKSGSDRIIGQLVQTPIKPTEAEVTSLGSLGDHTYRLKEPFDIDVIREGDSYVVAWRGTDQFGYGPSVVDAIRDLQLTIIELFQTLSDSTDSELSDHLRRLRDELQRHVATVSK